MNRISNVKRSRTRRARAYESPLRDDQVETTRGRILDALVRTMARGVAGLSMPAVAREAGVSIPTIYRHFHTKAELVAALAPYLTAKSGLMEIPRVEGNDLASILRELYRRNEAMDTETRAAMASQLGQEVRRMVMPERLALTRKGIAERLPGLTRDDLDHLTRVLLILMSSATMRAYKDYLGMDASKAVEDVVWATELMQRALAKGRR